MTSRPSWPSRSEVTNMRKFFAVLTLIGLSAAGVIRAADDDLAVVVGKTNSVDNLTKAQLRKIVLGEQSSWPGGKKVSVILRASGQPERAGVLQSVCGMKEDDY